MAILDTLTSGIQKLIESLISSLLGPAATKLIEKVTTGISNITNLFGDVQSLIDSVRDEADAWKNFREDIRIKSRVVNIPKAYDQTKSLIVGIKDSWNAVLDIIKEFKSKLGESPEAEAEEASADLEESGTGALTKRIPALGRFLEKTLGVVTLIVDALESISSVIHDLQTIVDEVTRVREEIESAESIFLSQKNPRRTLKLAQGGSIKIRVGNLHA
jgi:methyl-accepting chemotaxis protein